MGLIEEENTVFKNKKIVLSSIAIIFALVVSSIFVNYTLANSDSQASLSDANGSGSKSTSLTGLSNIDLAVKNSNDAGKKRLSHRRNHWSRNAGKIGRASCRERV